MNALRNSTAFVAVIMLVVAFAWLVSGCSVSLIGGRHQTNVFRDSDDNEVDADMQAPSQTSDFLKDLFPGGLPVVPTTPGQPPVTVPEEPPGPDPTEPPVGEHPIPPGAARDYTTLFKESTNDNGQPSGRGAVIVIDSTHWDSVAAVSIGGTAFSQSTDWDAGHNGWREHWRNDASAQSFHGSTVSVVLKDSAVLQDILDGSGGALYRDTLTLQ